MKILDRYIIRQTLTSFIVVILVLGVLILATHWADRLDDYIKHDVQNDELVQYYIRYLLFICATSMPLIVFVTTVFLTSRMANHSEIIAMLSTGMPFWRFLFPFIFSGATLAAISFSLISWIVPDANKYRVEFEAKYIKSPFYFKSRHVYLRLDDQTTLYLWRYELETSTAYNISLDRVESGLLRSRLRAKNMSWLADTGEWRLYGWNEQTFGLTEDTFIEGVNRDTTLALSPRDFENEYGLTDKLTTPELMRQITYLSNRGSNTLPYEAELHARYMQPFALVLLVLLGVIISFKRSRGGTAWRLTLAFVLVFLYVIFYTLARSTAEVGALPPAIGVWIPNLVFMGITAIFYWKLSK